MTRRHLYSSSALALVLCLPALLPGNARAQDRNNDGPASSITTPDVPSVAPGVVGPEQMDAGVARSTTWIAAPRFTGRNGTSTPVLNYASQHFYTSPGSASPVMYFAPLDLEAGLLLDMITCAFNDASATHNLSFEIQKAEMNFIGGTASWTSLGSGSSSGSPGISYVNIPVTPAETIQNQSGNTYYQYVIRADIASDVSFAGCMAYWTKQVSPGPASATFTDVPTSHGYFKYIEALYSAGITVGCSSTAFCPNDPLTRGQMAVFLARGLGLSYPQ